MIYVVIGEKSGIASFPVLKFVYMLCSFFCILRHRYCASFAACFAICNTKFVCSTCRSLSILKVECFDT